jgi:hypothetical protein
MTPA